QHAKIDTYACELIRRKARELVGRAGLTSQDREDLEQELLLRLLERLPAFDAERSAWTTFAALVIRRCAANLLRYRQAEKRDCRTTRSLYRRVRRCWTASWRSCRWWPKRASKT